MPRRPCQSRPGGWGQSVPVCHNRTSMPTTEQVTEALRAVIDPELRKNIVDLGMVRSIDFPADGRVDVVVSLTTPGCPIRSHFQQAVASNVSALEGVTEVGVGFDVLSEQEKGRLQQALGRSRGGFGSKLHLRCDRRGRPMAFVLTPGHRHEQTAFRELMRQGP